MQVSKEWLQVRHEYFWPEKFRETGSTIILIFDNDWVTFEIVAIQNKLCKK